MRAVLALLLFSLPALGAGVNRITCGSGLSGGTITVSGSCAVLYGSVPATAAQGNDPRIVSAAPLASPAFTGIPTAPTAAADTSTAQLATTGFVVGQGYAKIAAPLSVKTGANASIGASTCNGATEVTVTTTKATATALYWLSEQVQAGTSATPGIVYKSALSAGTSFGFKCTLNDTSTVAWLIIEPA